MGLFKKKAAPKPELVAQYSDVEQDAPPTQAPDPLAELCAKIDQVLANQKSIVANQQLIIDHVSEQAQALAAHISNLAQNSPGEPEPSEEELKAAALAMRKQKGGK